jgi:molybdopterin synthase sulfur carrier subunit
MVSLGVFWVTKFRHTNILILEYIFYVSYRHSDFKKQNPPQNHKPAHNKLIHPTTHNPPAKNVQISVRFFTVLREITDKKEETLQLPQDATIDTALQTLAQRYGEPFTEYVYDQNGKVKGFLQFFINGQSTAAVKGLDSKLHEEDVLAIVPPVGGG